MTDCMYGVVMTGHGDYDALSYRTDLPKPKPREREVLIRVGAAGVNNTDINTRIGWYSKNDGASEDAGWAGTALTFPRIQGADMCGEIVEVGSNVDVTRLGERVLVEPCLQRVNGEPLETPWYIGSECDGGFAQYVVVDASHAYPIQSTLSDVELASFPCSYSAAENMLTRANVQQGDVVLVTGASGGVGSAAVQLAKARGARVIAVTSASKEQMLLELGAEATLDRNDVPAAVLGQNSVDVVIDLVGGDKWPELLDVLRPKGRYAVSGAIAGPIVELDLRTLYLKDLSFFGCTVLEPEVFGNLVKRIENGDIKPLVTMEFPLESIVDAQKRFLEKSHVGKIVLTV
ncbi:NAD-dependent epimerase/dehydratase family protein [Rhodobacteraceae bacterium RKSG542]|uniref:alcohol dehydrogenase family protein n=1 Tax=Pseudovibrio flavus TaxID=2529854 RepID=UPI0012BC8F05|nr:alcohol dehydrogenase family protein [Pseudovibrio flavus]MTI16501.1 NAD-dependent epimerase/dehydratase family protein [Pseudovibrio flavus]